MEEYVCSRCGKPAASDSRMGSTDTYLTCNCEKYKYWVNDGQGGYYESWAKPVEGKEYYRRD